MQEYEIRSVKHGVGCTVVAALLAIAEHRQHRRVLLVDVDSSGDIAAVLGIPDFTHRGVVEQLRLEGAPFWATPSVTHAAGAGNEDYDTIVYDVGCRPGWDRKPGSKQVYVTRADYVQLRRWIHVAPAVVDMLVLIEEPGRALSVRDVETTIGHAVTHRIPFDPAISRAVDAGLLVSGYRGSSYFHPLRSV